MLPTQQPKAFYNENDPRAAAWLRELIAAGHIAPGEVDERSIAEIEPWELYGYTQCHFFAGIGGWSLALRLAGVPDSRPVWTGSCPCQPFSVAGKGLGERDERHLWPVFAELIRECAPSIVFGEQVASAAGRGWLSGVFANLEAMGYAVAGADLCAASVGAPHIRQRLYWMADAQHAERRAVSIDRKNEFDRTDFGREEAHGESGARREICAVANAEGEGRSRMEPEREAGERFGARAGGDCATGRVVLANGSGRDARGQAAEADGYGSAAESTGGNGGMCDANGAGRGEKCGAVAVSAKLAAAELRGNAWDSFDLLPCLDGKARRVESGTFPLAHGIPGRVGLLRGYGNAIVPQVAAEFIVASLEAIAE